MDILISCQCVEKHPAITIKKFDSVASDSFVKLTEPIYADYGINSVKYIDLYDCNSSDIQYTNWNDIEKESFDLIWPMHCPLWTSLSDKNKELLDETIGIWKSLLIDGWHVLKPNGVLVIPIWNNNSWRRTHIKIIKEFVKKISGSKNKWKLSESPNAVGFMLELDRALEAPSTSFILLRKAGTMTGGSKRRKTSKTRKIRKIRK